MKILTKKMTAFTVLMVFILQMISLIIFDLPIGPSKMFSVSAATALVNKAAQKEADLATFTYRESVDSFAGANTASVSSGVIGNVFDDNDATYYWPYGDKRTTADESWARTVARFNFKEDVDRKVNKIYLNVGSSDANAHMRAKTIVFAYSTSSPPPIVSNPSSAVPAGIANCTTIKGKLYMATAITGYPKDTFVDDVTSETEFSSVPTSADAMLNLSAVGNARRQYYFIPDGPIDAKSIVLFCSQTFNDGTSTGERVQLQDMRLYDVRGENLNLTVDTASIVSQVNINSNAAQNISLPLATVRDANGDRVSAAMESAVTITATAADGGDLPYGVSLDTTSTASPKLVVAADASPGSVSITWNYTDSSEIYGEGNETSATPVTKTINILSSDPDFLDVTTDIAAVTNATIIGTSQNTEINLYTSLPALPTVGANGSTFTWASNSTSAVVEADHTVTITRQDATTLVKLTLTAVKANTTLTKTFDFNIPGLNPQDDPFDIVRKKWNATLIGDDAIDLNNTSIKQRVEEVNVTAETLWSQLIKDSGRTVLFTGVNGSSTGRSANITTSYKNLYSMSMAYATVGGKLYKNSALLVDIIDSLEWLNTNWYNTNTTRFDNWWDFEIGTPIYLINTCMLIYNELSSDQILRYMNATAKFCNVGRTGTNRVWLSKNVAGRGILLKNSAEIAKGRDGITPVLDYVTTLPADGFFKDGSFIQHDRQAYTGGYGLYLINDLSIFLDVFSGSSWEIVAPNKDNIYDWINIGCLPLIYDVNMMDMVRGREISRGAGSSNSLLVSIVRMSKFAPSPYKEYYKSIVKERILGNPTYDFNSSLPIDLFPYVQNEILNADSVKRYVQKDFYKQFQVMDRMVARRGNFQFGVSMHSNQIYNYESINQENLRGWHTGDGMTYLYDKDYNQFNGNFWPTVDSYRLPGTTVETNTKLGHRLLNQNPFVGGVEHNGVYGATGMLMAIQGTTLKANKSYFMFDDEIVMVGSGVTNTSGKEVETIVENKKLNALGDNQFIINGVEQPTTTDVNTKITGIGWAYLQGNVENTNVGYYFPGGSDLNIIRENRVDSWYGINSRYGSKTPVTDNYLTMYYNHGANATDGKYSYVLLPGKTKDEVENYSKDPDVEILSQTTTSHAVKSKKLNMLMANFFGADTVSYIKSDNSCSVVSEEKNGMLDLSISDPTQSASKTIMFEIDKKATSVISADPQITVISLSPKIKFSVNVSNTQGKTFNIKLNGLSGLDLPCTISNLKFVSNAGTGTITVDVTNNTADVKSVNVIYAVYKMNKLVGVKVSPQIITAGEKKSLMYPVPITLGVPWDAIKAFVFDAAANLKALAQNVTFVNSTQ